MIKPITRYGKYENIYNNFSTSATVHSDVWCNSRLEHPHYKFTLRYLTLSITSDYLIMIAINLQISTLGKMSISTSMKNKNVNTSTTNKVIIKFWRFKLEIFLSKIFSRFFSVHKIKTRKDFHYARSEELTLFRKNLECKVVRNRDSLKISDSRNSGRTWIIFFAKIYKTISSKNVDLLRFSTDSKRKRYN